MQSERRVEYVAPTDEAIYAYTHRVCEQLAENGDSARPTLEVVSGLTDFLKN